MPSRINFFFSSFHCRNPPVTSFIRQNKSVQQQQPAIEKYDTKSSEQSRSSSAVRKYSSQLLHLSPKKTRKSNSVPPKQDRQTHTNVTMSVISNDASLPPSSPTISVTGRGRASAPKDQIEVLIKVTGGSSESSEAAMARVSTAFATIASRVKKAFENNNAGVSDAIALSFTAPLDTPLVEAFLSTAEITSTTIVPASTSTSGGGFFSFGSSSTSGPKTITTTRTSVVVGGHTCSAYMLMVATLPFMTAAADAAGGLSMPSPVHQKSSPPSAAFFAAKLIDTIDALSVDAEIFPPPPSSSSLTGKDIHTVDSRLLLAMNGFGVRYTASEQHKKALLEAARTKAFVDMRTRTADVAAAFGVPATSLRLANIKEASTSSSSSNATPTSTRNDAADLFAVNAKGAQGPKRETHDVERASVTISATYKIGDGSKDSSSSSSPPPPIIISFPAEGSVPAARSSDSTIATVSATLSAGRPTEQRDGLSAMEAFEELCAAQSVVTEAFKEAAFPNARLSFTAIPQFVRTNCYRSGKSKRNASSVKKCSAGNSKDDSIKHANSKRSSTSDNDDGEGGMFQTSSRLMITVNTQLSLVADKDPWAPSKSVGRVQDWLQQLLLDMWEEGDGGGSKNSKKPNIFKKVGAVRCETVVVSFGDGSADGDAEAEVDEAIKRSEDAARDAAITNAKSLAEDYGRRLGLVVVGPHAFSESITTTNGNNSVSCSGGGAVLSLGSTNLGRQQQQQQQFYSSSYSSGGQQSLSNLTMPSQTLTWKGTVAFAFASV